MATATFVKSAQKDIYTHGKRVTYISEKGKKAGQEKSKIDRSTPADANDTIFIKKGEPYYWWQFMNSSKQYSKTQPRRSQLTQSGFLSSLYDLEDRVSECSCSDKDDFDSFKEEVTSEIEDLRSQCEDSLSNMPDSLQQSPTGELLQERIDGLENWASEIEGIECDYDEDELREQAKDEVLESKREDSEDQSEEALEKITIEDSDEDAIEERFNELAQEKVDEAISELQNTSAGL